MRVLLTNVRLEDRGGSELYLADVARWLRDHGHQPLVYTARAGAVAEALRAEAIPVVSDPAGIGEAPDLIHAQHHLATMAALATFPLVPAVGFCHGWIPWEEAPVRHPAIRRYVAVSSITRERIVSEAAIPAPMVRVVPNFVDLDRFRPRAPLPARPQRALVFSNAAGAGGWADVVVAACRARGIEVDVAGLTSGNPIADPERVLPAYDLVFARGRSALEAMAVGAAVILCDIEGCGPFVTAARFERLREGNFGQYVMRQPHHGPYLGEQIDAYDRAAAAAASALVRTTLGRDRVVAQLLDVYAEAIADARARPHTLEAARAAEGAYLRWLDVNYPRPVLESFRRLDGRVHELEAVLAATEARAAGAELEQERLRAEAAASEARAQAIEADYERFRSGLLIRLLLRPLWALRERLVPTGSRRHRAYRALLFGERPTLGIPARDALARRVTDLALNHGPYVSSSLRLHALAARTYWLVRQGRRGIRPWRGPARVLRIRRVASLPSLAWVAVVGERTCEVTIGPHVEATESGVFEGVWEGDFGAFEPQLAEFAHGSGVIRLGDGRIRFVSPRHTTESLYVVGPLGTGETIVSNSLAFALLAGQAEVGSGFFETVAAQLLRRSDEQDQAGFDWAQPLIVRHGDRELHRISYHGFEIDGRGRPRMLWTAPRAYFSDFASYRSFLATTTEALIRNGADERRRRRFRPITTISSGYDSVAVSSLLATLGYREAVTLDVEVYGRRDCGRPAADALGLDVEVFQHVVAPVIDALDFPFDGGLAEQAFEFIATSGVGDDVTFLPFEPRLAGRLLFTGRGGDGVWEREKPLRPGMPQTNPFGRSMTEFRLRVGFALMVTPRLGSRFPAPVNRLSSSDELAAFSLGGPYDRPIARRIAEDAGVPRHVFGREKAANAPLPLNRQELFPRAMAAVMERYAGWTGVATDPATERPRPTAATVDPEADSR